MPTSDIPEVEAVRAHTCGLDGSARWDGFREALSALETALRTARANYREAREGLADVLGVPTDLSMEELHGSVAALREERDSARSELDRVRTELLEAQHAIGEAWFAGGATTAQAIERKTAMLERLARTT